MTGIKKVKITCKTISPVHIGSGESLSRFEYYINNDSYVYIIDQNEFISFLKNSKNIMENNKNKKLTLQDLAKTDYMEEYQNYVNEGKSESSLNGFLDSIDKDIANQIINKIKSANKKVKLDFNPENNKREINLFARSAGMPYIPGSSIKGAIWTAILYKYLNDESNQDLKNSIKTEKNGEILKPIIDQLQEKFGRYFMVSDAFFDNNTVITKTNEKPEVWIESIKNNEQFTFELVFKEKLFNKLQTENTKYFWIKIHENYIKIDPPFTSVKDITDSLKSFYNDAVWNYELENLNKEDKLRSFYEENNKPENTLIRVGAGSSSIAVSLYLLFKDDKEIQNILKNKIRNGKEPKTKTERFPILREYTEDKNGKIPYGWVELIQCLA
ncbi:MAG: type III-A CRISPR-associated RAMP protein Csm5 [bacterium]